MNRSEINRALAKAIAYKQCGKEKDAEQWARELIRLLELNQILKGWDDESGTTKKRTWQLIGHRQHAGARNHWFQGIGRIVHFHRQDWASESLGGTGMNDKEKKAIEAALINLSRCREYLISIAGTDNILLSDFVLDLLEMTAPIQQRLGRLQYLITKQS
jgi:hypothetical protein